MLSWYLCFNINQHSKSWNTCGLQAFVSCSRIFVLQSLFKRYCSVSSVRYCYYVDPTFIGQSYLYLQFEGIGICQADMDRAGMAVEPYESL